jgi:hypothetical protein
MRFSIAVVVISATCSLAGADEAAKKQLPKRCVAESPNDVPCSAIAGTYRLRIEPVTHDDRCFIKKPIEADVTLGLPLKDGLGLVDTKAQKLVKKLGWKQRKIDDRGASADLRDGVCCIDLRLTETSGKPKNETERRLIVHMAAGRTVVNAVAEERIMPDHGDDCQNDLVVTAKRIK